MKEICGFDRSAPGFGFAFETGLSLEDRGFMPEEEFKKTCSTIRPDARFWAEGGARQIIIECKGTGPNKRTYFAQAQRYLSYLQDREADGAVVYIVRFQRAEWQKLIEEAAERKGRFGAIEWTDNFLRPFSPELIEVIWESIVATSDLLKRALKLRRPSG